ncbi:MAG TPA: hypothetical protein VG838_11420 [Opitutaceae bacterium]|nr:hypothetical protein [Opitutaceae bacterium]
MEYFLVVVLGLALAAGLALWALAGGKRLKGPGLSADSQPGRGPAQPSADEPSPSASSVAPREQAERAQRRTPPA